MIPTPTPTPVPDSTDGPSRALLSAAVAGLVGLGEPSCGSPQSGVDGGGPHVISVTTDPTMTADAFSALCEGRGGYLQTTAVCAGSNSCKGVSFLPADSTLVEHSCKGMNSCGPGLSCVELPVDQGKTGEAIYREACAICHGAGSDSSHFALWVTPGTDLALAKTAFLARSPLYHESMVAFGVHLAAPNGTALVAMPPFHERYSRKEIERVVRYVLAMPVDAERLTISGWDAGSP